jgi:hypothetical protein
MRVRVEQTNDTEDFFASMLAFEGLNAFSFLRVISVLHLLLIVLRSFC